MSKTDTRDGVREELKSIKIYRSDWKEINQVCLNEDISQPDAVRKILENFKKKR